MSRISQAVVRNLLEPFNETDAELLALLASRSSNEHIEFDKICDRLRTLLHSESCAIFLADHTPGSKPLLRLVGQSALNGKRVKAKPVPIQSAKGGGLTAHMAAAGRVFNLIRRDIVSLKAYLRQPGKPSPFIEGGIDDCLLAIPLLNRKETVVGLLKLVNKVKRGGAPRINARFSADDQLAGVLFGWRLMVALESRNFMRYSQKLLRASESIMVGAESKNGESILKAATELVRADSGAIFKWNEETGRLTVAEKLKWSGAKLRIPEGSALEGYWHRRDDITAAFFLDALPTGEGLAPLSSSQSAVLIPTEPQRTPNKFTGLLVVESRRPDAFDDLDRKALQDAATAYALASRRASRDHALGEALQLQTQGDPESPNRVFRGVLECVKAGMGFDAGLLYEVDARRENLVIQATIGCEQISASKKEGRSVSLNRQSLARTIFVEPRPMFSLKPESDSRVSKRGLKDYSIRGPMIGAPLIHAGNPVGVILFWSRRGAIPAEYDLGTLSAFANAGAAEMALWKMSYLWGQFVHKVGNYSMPIVNAGTYLKQMPLDTAGMAVVEQFDASASLLRATLRTTIEYRKLLARQPKQERFCAIGCLLEVIKSQESAADAKNVTIKRPAVPKRQVEVEGDREMLSDAFANLISNAIRYTKQNSEVIAASTVKAGFLEITISDFGPGVPAENRPHIFLPYMSLPTDGHHRSGLGLASARHGVNANGGKVELVISKRQPTSGASFRIRLPLRRPDKPDMI